MVEARWVYCRVVTEGWWVWVYWRARWVHCRVVGVGVWESKVGAL